MTTGLELKDTTSLAMLARTELTFQSAIFVFVFLPSTLPLQTQHKEVPSATDLVRCKQKYTYCLTSLKVFKIEMINFSLEDRAQGHFDPQLCDILSQSLTINCILRYILVKFFQMPSPSW